MKADDLLKNIDSVLSEHLIPHGFNRLGFFEYGRVIDGTLQHLIFSKSKSDFSLYVEAFVSLTDIKIPMPYEEDSVYLGGRVSPAGIDFLDYSFKFFSPKEFLDEFVSVYQEVIATWFNVFSSVQEVQLALEGKAQVVDFCVGNNFRMTTKFFVETFEGFFDAAKTLGFSFSINDDAVLFFRKNGWKWDVFIIEIFGYGVFAAIRVATWLPSLQVFDGFTDDSSPSDFERLCIINGGYIGLGGLEAHPRVAFNIASRNLRDHITNKLLSCLKSEGLGFYQIQQNPKEFLQSIDPIYKNSSYFQETLEKISAAYYDRLQHQR